MAPKAEWPALAEDLDLLEAELETKRHEHSHRANAKKRLFLVWQWVAVVGGVVLVALGVIGTSLGDSQGPAAGQVQFGLAVAGAVISFAIGVFVLVGREMNWQREWLDERVASEQLKHEFYFYLGRVGEYGEAGDPTRVLSRRIRAVEDDLAAKRYLSLGGEQ